MGMRKFNGFENYIITQALEYWVDAAEKDIVEQQRQGKNSLIAPGYFTMVVKELKEKVQDMTLKDKHK